METKEEAGPQVVTLAAECPEDPGGGWGLRCYLLLTPSLSLCYHDVSSVTPLSL